MTLVPSFDYELAPNLEAALNAVADAAIPIHGGTELLPAMSLGLIRPRRLVSIRTLNELRVCRREDDDLVLGAGLTHNEVATSVLAGQGAPLLSEVSSSVGNVRVRCTGTLGGNLAFAEPRSDIATVLLALDARLRLADTNGHREVPLSQFLVGAYETGLREGELITAVTLPFAQTSVGVYRRVAFSERPVVGVALTFARDRGWRLVVGAVGMFPVVIDSASLDEIDPAGIAAGLDAIVDLSGSEQYKRHLAAVTVERCRRAAAAQGKQAG